jgi:ABC-type antimicrobial peptide transport system permease subunit
MLSIQASPLRHALRRPGFILGTGLILGLALGANVAAFAILYGYLVRPLPYAAPGELLVPREQDLKIHLTGPQVTGHFFATVRRLPPFRDAALFSFDDATVEAGGTSTRESYSPVTPSAFALLGVKPLLGRTLSAASGRPGGPPEVVLSYGYWMSAFRASPSALGSTLRLNGQALRIVGVMPPGFVFPGPGAAFWTPIVVTPALARSHDINPFMLIRRPPGWTIARVDAMLQSAHERGESPADRATERKRGFRVDAVPYRSVFGSPAVVGRTLQCSLGTCRIVGVVSSIQDRYAGRYSSGRGTVFVPEEPDTFRAWRGPTTILIRSTMPPAVLARELRNLVQRTLPDQSLNRFASMHELISDSARNAAALASLLIAFGLLAFTLATIGTYGVVAYATGLRRREFAVRQAVGAQPVQIESLVLGQGLMLWLLGAVSGVGCALIFARSLAAELYRVSLLSPANYVVPAVIVGAAVMLASWIPARRARKLDLIAQFRPE